MYISFDEGQNVETGNIYGSLHSAIERRVLFSPEVTASLVRSFFLRRRTLNCLTFSWCAPRWSFAFRLDFVGFFGILIMRHTRARERREGRGLASATRVANAFPDKLTSDLDALRGRAPVVSPPTFALCENDPLLFSPLLHSVHLILSLPETRPTVRRCSTYDDSFIISRSEAS